MPRSVTYPVIARPTSNPSAPSPTPPAVPFFASGSIIFMEIKISIKAPFNISFSSRPPIMAPHLPFSVNLASPASNHSSAESSPALLFSNGFSLEAMVSGILTTKHTTPIILLPTSIPSPSPDKALMKIFTTSSIAISPNPDRTGSSVFAVQTLTRPYSIFGKIPTNHSPPMPPQPNLSPPHPPKPTPTPLPSAYTTNTVTAAAKWAS